MSFGNIIGSLLQQGMSGSTQSRMHNATGRQGLGGHQGGGLDSLINNFMNAGQDGTAGRDTAGRGTGSSGGLMGALTGGSGGSSGGLMGTLSGLLGQGKQTARQNPTMAAGGLGAVAGALLGGASGGSSMRGAVGGGAMALLGTMAISALKNWQANQPSDQPAQTAVAPGLAEAPTAPPDLEVPPEKVEEMTSAAAQQLVLRGMIQAAKADGQVSPEELGRIAGKIGEDDVTPDEKQYVMEEIKKPLDVEGLIRDIPSQEVGAQVYAAALMAIEIDTPAEKEFLRRLAQGIGLDASTVQQLHMMTGAPTPT